jgi:hypothetical protein
MQSYKKDILVWAKEQSALLRAGRFDLIDVENIAEEIEEVGKSEQRELRSRMSVLICHLLKCQYQPSHQSSSWTRTIKEQRDQIFRSLKISPSLKSILSDEDWKKDAWSSGVVEAIRETGLSDFPEECPWSFENQILDAGWLPDSEENKSTWTTKSSGNW